MSFVRKFRFCLIILFSRDSWLFTDMICDSLYKPQWSRIQLQVVKEAEHNGFAAVAVCCRITAVQVLLLKAILKRILYQLFYMKRKRFTKLPQLHIWWFHFQGQTAHSHDPCGSPVSTTWIQFLLHKTQVIASSPKRLLASNERLCPSQLDSCSSVQNLSVFRLDALR